ncbi:3-keto-steroid reductase [Yamadazyma tenuis]|uniref:3beta-hydroxysteroid 3-dehydrogenase n=1 Tax=Candida tenuis (strain ATCC 10573 / BCRC 21748 / CBS 615 / JCM 9827 / NBRC 10315 / NRRL Y-1498 / VKM Y-70) TaxID=590646 RepID=G3B068_CANTC|nr:3-keto-steroid reductase [Yamadazyma tenuis ATCC 10573]XP_006685192.1 uncharacterized protein CANTEDRAFT_113050 [Yamadazyma tenuis ATCC 10573]EGV65505.1 3-keto-steroid reductase [Yamadazyma tenuis ATCC 10573]EGV65506.1 hypothetical protein CANTEDRAFT_113050 [Yamadazyma tenuis ATCC 10573]WEJ95013.1 3-keto-steroid reductase [Yamadazyma tenuis]
MSTPNHKVALITGGSSNLGISLAKRLIDNLSRHQKLSIIITSRTLPKAIETIDNINAFAKQHQKSTQLEFDYILVDFGDMVSVLSAYYDLNKKYPHIDYAFMNSVQTCYAGIDWVYAIKDVLKSPVNAVTEAHMKIQKKGLKSHDGMGLMFQGNVFGPYYLLHKIKPLMTGGKIVWVSSSSSGAQYISFNDLQMLENPYPYEGSKRLIDLVHSGTYKSLKSKDNISSYVVNPGIFTSFGFFQYLNFVTFYGMLGLFYLARFLGSTIHNISGYTAANSLISCALKDDERQDKKVVSSTNISGKEYIDYVEIDGTGAEDVVAYLETLCKEWDEKFKNQIVDTRVP